MKVLIVDDDEVDRQIVKRALAFDGTKYSITEAETVDEGLLYYSEGHFDLILLDYRMPGRDGVEMILAMKESGVDNSAAIVMMSNSEDDSVAMAAINAGAQDFILKAEINSARLRRAIMHAQTRFALEAKLRESYHKVKELAEKDSLTGLANRYLFDESLKMSIGSNVRGKTKIALMLIDLDHFKYVNDNFGHDYGDALLQNVVKRISTCLRGSELFARLGGDEFGITITHLNRAEDASKIARRILLVLEKPFDIKGQKITSGASIGIAIYPENGNTPEELFKNADIAMYRAKKMGRNQSCFFEQSMQEQFVSRFKIENDIRLALRQNQFFLNYQSVVVGAGESVVGVEALLYWRDTENKIHSPGEFISVAEDSKFIIELGRWVIAEAISVLANWNSVHSQNLCMALNISPVQLLDKSLPEYLAGQLIKHKQDAHSLIIELTETALLNVSDESVSTIRALSELGCRIALDDFGLGFSSISHLRDFPIDIVKIDRSLMPTPTSTDKQHALFRALIAMIQSLELEVVAEGVETEAQVTLCKSLRVECMQGYFFSKPAVKEVFEKTVLLR